MKINYKITLVLSVACLILFISPCIYLLPAADDYCGMIELKERGGFWGNIVQSYFNWGGGYSGAALQYFSPLNFNYSYLLVPIVSVVIGVLCVNYLLNAIFKIEYSLIYAICFNVLCIALSTEIYEMLYWFIGVASYTWGTWISMFLLGLAINSITSQKTIFIFISSISILLFSALNSISVAALPLFLFVSYFSSENKKPYLYFGMLSVIVFCLAMFAPGNFSRATNFSNNFKVLHSTGMSLLQTIRFIFLWTSKPVFILSFFATYYLGNKKIIQLKHSYNNKLLIGAILLLMFYAAFMPYMGTGILGQHRTYNATLPWFILITHILAVKWGAQNKTFLQVSQKNQKITFVMAFISILILGNGKNIIHDHIQNNFEKNYLIQLTQLEQVKQSHDLKLSSISENKTVLNTYKGYKLIPGSEHWINECTYRYFKEIE